MHGPGNLHASDPLWIRLTDLFTERASRHDSRGWIQNNSAVETGQARNSDEATDVFQSRRVLIVHLSTEGLFPESIKEITSNYNRIKSLQSEHLVRIHDCRTIRNHNHEDVVFICEMHGAKSFKESPKPRHTDILNFFTL